MAVPLSPLTWSACKRAYAVNQAARWAAEHRSRLISRRLWRSHEDGNSVVNLRAHLVFSAISRNRLVSINHKGKCHGSTLLAQAHKPNKNKTDMISSFYAQGLDMILFISFPTYAWHAEDGKKTTQRKGKKKRRNLGIHRNALRYLLLFGVRLTYH